MYHKHTTNILSHVRTQHRNVYNTEERAEAVKREADTDLRSPPKERDLFSTSKEAKDMLIIKYIVSTGQAKGMLLSLTSITCDHHPTNPVLFVRDRRKR